MAASHGAEAAAGSDAPHAEVIGVGQTNPSPCPPSSVHHSWPSSAGSATVSWNYPVEKPSQDTVYYDPQRDVSVSGGDQNVGSSETYAAQSTMGIANAAQSHAPYSSSVQHGYNNPVEYANYYYSYQQATNDSSVQQGANQHPGAAYQPLTSFQNSGSYVDPTSNTYYNGGQQTVPGYGSSSYYYQNNTWNDGSSGNNYAQSYQNYSSSDTSAIQTSSSVPAHSQPYQQQYNQWPYYYNHSAPSASSNPVAENSATDTIAINNPSGYSYPSNQPPPPGTTSWKSNSVASFAPPMQAPGVPGPQNHYTQAEGQYSQAPTVSWSQHHYANQAHLYPQNTMNSNHAPLSNPEAQQRTGESKGPSSNILSTNHVSENFRPNLQGSVTTDTSSESKMQIPNNPRIAPGFSMVMQKSEKKNFGADLSMKPAYVSVPRPTNDTKETQVGPDARSVPFSLRNYTVRNLNRCKDDAQRVACRNILQEITSKAIADGTVLTKNWDTEPLLPLPESVVAMTETNANISSPFLSTSIPRKRAKSRWEPAVEEKVTNKVDQITKGLVNNNIHSSWEAKNRMGGSWDHGKFIQSHQAPVNKANQRPAKKQKIINNSSQIQNGNASSDSDKEQDLTKYYASATALANSPEEKKRREHRSKRFEKSQDSSFKSRTTSSNRDAMANLRTRKPISSLFAKTYEEDTSLAVEDMDWDALTIKGTCQEIEKQYLRLTSAPDPSTVRPEDVLEKSLAMVETLQKNYLYKCDQLKSIRQDLTVQRIQNEFTIKVYETHARLAMQAGDLAEYNQCQSQLKRLYTEGIKGCYFEFSAYSLLYVMLHSNNKRDLLSSMASLSKEAKQDGAVKHALAVHSAVLSGNYVLFFKLYKQAPNLNSYFMDLYVERMRFEAMKCMSKSYGPTLVPVGYVAQILGFLRTDTEGCVINGGDGLEECEIWLKAHGAVLSVDNNGESQIDMKASTTTLNMPEPENAVAHGDSSLAVSDFFSRASEKV